MQADGGTCSLEGVGGSPLHTAWTEERQEATAICFSKSWGGPGMPSCCFQGQEQAIHPNIPPNTSLPPSAREAKESLQHIPEGRRFLKPGDGLPLASRFTGASSPQIRPLAVAAPEPCLKEDRERPRSL